MLCLVNCLHSIHHLCIPNKYHIHEIQIDPRRFERGSLTHKLVWYLIVSIPDLCNLTYFDPLQLIQILARRFLPSHLSDSKIIHLMCITAYSSTYLKMTSEETSTEN